MADKSSRLSRLDFIKVCDMLRENREVFTTERPTREEAATKLSVMTGITVKAHHIQEIKQGAGVEWQRPHKSKSPTREKHQQIIYHVLRTLIEGVSCLYNKSSATPTDDLIDLFEYFEGKVSTLVIKDNDGIELFTVKASEISEE